MHLLAEHRGGHRAADQRGGDVVEEGREHEDHHQQQEAALPIVGEDLRQHHRHVGILEVLREQREAHEEPEEVGEDHPLVREQAHQAGQPRALRESRKEKLVDGHREETGDRDLERVALQEGDAEEDEREQDEVDRDRPQHHGLVGRHGGDSSRIRLGGNETCR